MKALSFLEAYFVGMVHSHFHSEKVEKENASKEHCLELKSQSTKLIIIILGLG